MFLANYIIKNIILIKIIIIIKIKINFNKLNHNFKKILTYKWQLNNITINADIPKFNT